MNEPKSLRTYAEFWPYYVGEHLNPVCRRLHLAGTAMVLAFGVLGTVVDRHFLYAMPLAGYAFAWVGHFAFEKNRPATFRHPLWSLAADFHMFALSCLGRMEKELARVRSSRTRA